MKSINLIMNSVKVESKTRSITPILINGVTTSHFATLRRASWNRETLEDLSAHHNLDIEKELSLLLKQELKKERVSKRKKSINKIFQN